MVASFCPARFTYRKLTVWSIERTNARGSFATLARAGTRGARMTNRGTAVARHTSGVSSFSCFRRRQKLPKPRKPPDGGPPPRLRQKRRNRPLPPAISAAPRSIIYWRRSRFIRVLFPRRRCPPAPMPFRWSRPGLARQEQGGSFLRHSRGKANSLVASHEIQRARNERKVRDVDVVVWSGVCVTRPRAKSVTNWRGGPDAALAAAA
jgi:hypothetical protein